MSLPVDFSRPSPVDGYYDVFLSFRGQDTRKGFTTNLYHALQQNEIHTFMDVDLMGEEITYLFNVIEKSRMGVVIYSERFASSDWSLRELETILQRQKDKKMLVTPIFYKVDLKELKHLTGKTAQYLDEHIADYGEKTVREWKAAVTKLGGVSGISYKEIENRSEYDFIKHVIDRIKKKIKAGCDSNPEGSIKSSKINKQWSRSDDQGAVKISSAAQNTSRLNQVDKQESDEDSAPASSRNQTTPIVKAPIEKRRTSFYEAKVADRTSITSRGFSNVIPPPSRYSAGSTRESSKGATYSYPNRSAASLSRVMKIYVIALFRLDPITLQVESGTTVSTVKAQVKNILGLKITVDKQHLYYNGEELQDNTRNLASYKIPNKMMYRVRVY